MTNTAYISKPGHNQNVPAQGNPSPYVMVQQDRDGQNDIRSLVLTLLAGTLVVGGCVWGISHVVKTQKQKHQEKSALTEGSPSATAQQLKMAFDNDGWWGTNVPVIRSVFQNLTSKDFYRKVDRAYTGLTKGNSLNKDMQDELTTTEYNEMMYILASKPDRTGGKAPNNVYQQWAKRLKAAFDYTVGFFSATDEDAITAVFTEFPTQQAYDLTAAAYLVIYGRSLKDDLAGEISSGEVDELMNKLKQKPIN
jgi:hypothetical protein